MPPLRRTEMNNAEDIIRETGVVPMRRVATIKPATGGSAIGGCQGKVAFMNKDAAGQSARRGTAPYRCKYCRHWHVGSRQK